MSRVTLQAIADRAGVARSTVSMALRNHREVSPETVKRIQALAKEMGYVPNPMISTLMADIRDKRIRKRTINLALVYPFPKERIHGKHDPGDTPHRFYNGIMQRAEQLGYNVDLISLQDEQLDEKRLKRILKARGVYGVVLGLLPREVLAWSLWEEFTCGVLGIAGGLGYHRADNDQHNVVKTICRNLHEKGYRRAGFIINQQKQDERYVAAVYAFAKLFASKLDISIFEVEQTRVVKPGDHDLLNYYPEIRKQKLEVVVSHAPYSGVNLLHERGILVPQEFSYVCADIPPHEMQLSGISQNYEAVASAVVDTVDAQLHRNEKGLSKDAKFIAISGKWVDGETCPDLNK